MRVAMTMAERCHVRTIVLVISSLLANATCERMLLVGAWCSQCLYCRMNCTAGPVVIDVGKGRKAP